VTDSLLAFVRRQFSIHPSAPAMAFSPVSMLSCSQSTSQAKISEKEEWLETTFDDRTGVDGPRLPRLGARRDSEAGVVFEVKLVVRSEAVDFVFTHFISQLSEKWRVEDIKEVPPRQGVLLHYRGDSGVGGTIFECIDRNRSLEEKIRADLTTRCIFSLPMTLDRKAQKILLSPGSDLYKRMEKKSKMYTKKDRLDYLKLGWQGKKAVKDLLERYQWRMKEAEKVIGLT